MITTPATTCGSGHGGCNLREAEVRYLGNSSTIEKDVGALQVPVYDPQIVQKLEPLHKSANAKRAWMNVASFHYLD